eukprot:9846969-Prorocentrum_lima.AAC.1
MVLLTRMRARDIDKQTKPAILVLCYLNRLMVPFKACCQQVVRPDDVQAMTVDASHGRTARTVYVLKHPRT